MRGGGPPRTAPAFTLIELMIAVAIIAILAAMAIPSLLRSRMAANERAAAAGLRLLVSSQAVWRSIDADGNGVKDYLAWPRFTIADFYHQTNRAGDKLQLIDIAFAKACMEASSTEYPKAGYLYGSIQEDERGTAYTAISRYRYGFGAIPAVYQDTGTRTFVVDEEGVIYAKDVGDPLQLSEFLHTFPGTDPTATQWSVEQE